MTEVVPRQHPGRGRPTEALDISAGLGRWAALLTRRRAAVVARRYLLVALLIALVPAIVVLAQQGSRPLWVLGVLVVAPLAAAVALTQRTPDSRAARLVDRALGLHEQLGTALELQSEPTPARGLAALVVSEATVTLGQSLVTARVRTRRAPAEWLWLLLALCALGLVIALPRHAATNHGSGGGSGLASARSPGASGAERSGQSTASHTTTTSAAGGTASTAAVQRVPLTGGARAAYGVQSNRAPGSRAPVNVKGTATVSGQNTRAGLSVSGATGAGTAGKPTGQSQSGTGAGGTKTGVSGSTQGGKPGASRSKATTGANGGHTGQTSTTAGPTAGASTGSQKGNGRSGTPAAGGAGTAKQATPYAALGLKPYGGASTGGAALSLQASDTPASSSHVSGKEGVSQTASGNGAGTGRTGHPGSATAGSGGSGADLSVIPPTSNASASPDQDLVQNYFGMSNQLTFKGW